MNSTSTGLATLSTSSAAPIVLIPPPVMSCWHHAKIEVGGGQAFALSFDGGQVWHLTLANPAGLPTRLMLKGLDLRTQGILLQRVGGVDVTGISASAW